ncbi:hypothetical protein Tco_0922885 [Tanacetum coccineum]|uniref:Reverse transcriptase domain-containing protein n=1 Tax=Tanacetum coccineum TaxID=301880 RepID=A0ABQ5CZE4_9ASTR
MSTSSNLFSPLRDPESLIRRRNLGEPSSIFDFKEVMSIPHNNMGPPPAGPPPPPNNGPPPVVRPNGPAPRSMEELCQPSIDGRGGPIAPISIQATDFGLRHHMIQQQNGVSDDALRLSLFQYSLTHHAIACNTVANPRGDVKAITTQSGVAYDGLTIPPTPSPPPIEVKRETKVIKDKLITMLILGKPFLRTTRALIDVYGEVLTLRVDDEAITFKVGQTLRYSRSYGTVNQVNVIDVACEVYAQEVLGFSDSSTSGNPTPSDPIIASSSPSFTPFKGGDFILEEIETFLRTPKELSNLDDDYYDTEGDILYLEKLLNEDPSPTLPPMKNDDLKQVDVTMTKPSIEEPP